MADIPPDWVAEITGIRMNTVVVAAGTAVACKPMSSAITVIQLEKFMCSSLIDQSFASSVSLALQLRAQRIRCNTAGLQWQSAFKAEIATTAS
jgi:hypothetical protein